MASPSEHPNVEQLPAWAVDQATNETLDGEDGATIAARAREIVRAAKQRDDERHDEYDDPDLGGEA